MTASIDLHIRRTSPLGAILLALLALGLVGSLAAAVQTLVPTIAMLQAEGSGQDARDMPATAARNLVAAAGGAVESASWKVTFGELQWGRTDDVYGANPYRRFVVPDGWEWVLLPVDVTSKIEDSVGAAPLTVQLMAGTISMSHRYKSTSHYPSSTLPEELDIRAIAPGGSTAGNVGWMIPSAARAADACLIRVTLGETSAVFACTVNAKSSS